MSAYLMNLMKEAATRTIASRPSRATVGALITEAKKSLRRGELSLAEFAQLGGHVFGIALAFHAIGENQAVAGLRALRLVSARAKTGKRSGKKRAGKKKRSKKRGKKTRGRRPHGQWR